MKVFDAYLLRAFANWIVSVGLQEFSRIEGLLFAEKIKHDTTVYIDNQGQTVARILPKNINLNSTVSEDDLPTDKVQISDYGPSLEGFFIFVSMLQ